MSQGQNIKKTKNLTKTNNLWFYNEKKKTHTKQHLGYVPCHIMMYMKIQRNNNNKSKKRSLYYHFLLSSY